MKTQVLRKRVFLILVVVAAVSIPIGVGAILLTVQDAMADPPMAYSDFIAEAQAGNVTSIHAAGNLIYAGVAGTTYQVVIPDGVDVVADLAAYAPSAPPMLVTDPPSQAFFYLLSFVVPILLVLLLLGWARHVVRRPGSPRGPSSVSMA